MMAPPGITPEEICELANDALYIVLREQDGVIKEFDFANTRAEAYRIELGMTQWDGEISLIGREDA